MSEKQVRVDHAPESGDTRVGDDQKSNSIDRVEIMRLLNQVVNDDYTEPALEQVHSAEERELYDAINRLYYEKRRILSDFDANLRRSERRLRDIIESTPVGICITNRDHIYEYVNPTYCRLYGYEPHELTGQSFTIVVPEAYREQLTQLHDEFMGRRYELRGEWKVIRKDGRELDIIAEAAYIVDVDGEPKKVTFVVDITNQKSAERKLRETVDKLNSQIAERRRIEKVKNQVERIIRHDLRNPLNGIIVMAQLLERTELSDEQKELVSIILQSGNKLNEMLNTSLDIVQMEEGRYVLKADELSLNEVLSAAVAEVRNVGESDNITVDLNELNVPDTVQGETLHLENLFSNLIRNAIEASRPGDVVTVRVQKDDEYTVDIHNNGVIPEDIRDRFFDQYVTSGKPDGSGIGTYVAKLIASVHGGTIEFTSSESEGTHLFVRLPLQAPEQHGIQV